jgi:hypothetical protein
MVAAGAGLDGELYAVPIENGQQAGELGRIRTALPEDITAARTTAGGFQILTTGAAPAAAGFALGLRSLIASLDNENHLGPWKPLDLVDYGRFPSWSPDGRQIAYVGIGKLGPGTSIRIRTVENGEDRELFRERSANLVINCIWAVQRPNLYCGGIDGESQKTAVLSVPLNSGVAERIGSFDGAHILLRVSPDDRTLDTLRLLGPPGGGGIAVYAWKIGTAKETELPRGFVSPGGRWAFAVDFFSAGRREIRIRPASDPEGWKHLVDLNYPLPPGAELHPNPVKVSPDDNWVVYQNQDPDGKFGLYRVSTSGGEPERLGDYPTSETSSVLAVRPDNRQFIVQYPIPNRPAEFWVLENFLPKSRPAR